MKIYIKQNRLAKKLIPQVIVLFIFIVVTFITFSANIPELSGKVFKGSLIIGLVIWPYSIILTLFYYLDKNPLLVLDKKGLYTRTFLKDYIEWKDVGSVQTGTYISINIKNAKKYVAKKSLWQQYWLKFNWGTVGYNLKFKSSEISVSGEDLEKEIEKFKNDNH